MESAGVEGIGRNYKGRNWARVLSCIYRQTAFALSVLAPTPLSLDGKNRPAESDQRKVLFSIVSLPSSVVQRVSCIAGTPDFSWNAAKLLRCRRSPPVGRSLSLTTSSASRRRLNFPEPTANTLEFC